MPRDRNGTFAPQLIEKHQRRFSGFDDKILSIYALGVTVRDTRATLQEWYGVDVSSEVTDSALEEVKAWQDRPLEALYPIVYLDALTVRMRQDGKVENRARYAAIGINVEGQKSVLGLWAKGNEGAKYWTPGGCRKNCVSVLRRREENEMSKGEAKPFSDEQIDE